MDKRRCTLGTHRGPDGVERPGCGQWIHFARTVKSGGTKYMPLDVDPHPAGEWALDERGWAYKPGSGEATLTLWPDPDGDKADRYRTHFDTCANYERERAPMQPRRDTGDGIENR